MIEIDSSFMRIDDAKLRGRKPKYKFKKGGQSAIFKYGAINYEIYAELIAEEIGAQMGIEMAHYNYAVYNGIKGVLTPVFLKEKYDELIVSSYSLNDSAQKICEENSIYADLKGNTISNIVQAACIYDERIDSEELTFELMKRWVFYGLIMESDKNNTNISFIKGNHLPLRLSPDYDNSTMARMNEDINGFIESMRFGHQIYNYTDGVKCSLKLYDDSSDEFLPNFGEFVKKYPVYSKKIMTNVELVDVALAIELVEYSNQIEVPWNVKYWLEKAIESRKNDMISIYNNVIASKSLIKK